MWSQTVKYSMQSTTQRQCCVSKFRRPSPITRMHASKGKTTEKLTIHIFLCCIFTPYSNPRKNLVRVRNRLCFGFLKKMVLYRGLLETQPVLSARIGPEKPEGLVKTTWFCHHKLGWKCLMVLFRTLSIAIKKHGYRRPEVFCFKNTRLHHPSLLETPSFVPQTQLEMS